MAKTKKRILALVLTLAMVFTALAVTAVADEPEHSDECTIDATACTCDPKEEDGTVIHEADCGAWICVEGCGFKKAQDAVDAFRTAYKDLPAVEGVTAKNAADIQAAVESFKGLSSYAKTLLEDAKTVEENLKTLEAAAKEAAAKEAAAKEAADKVIRMIEALPEADKITLNDGDAFNAAVKAYEALTTEQEELVTNAEKLDELNEALAELAAAAGAYEAAPLRIDAGKKTISVGETTNLEGAGNSKYTHRWTSSNPGVATVSWTDNNATVTGESAGTVTITHECWWHGFYWSETIQITVNDSGGSTTKNYPVYVYMRFVDQNGDTLTPTDLADLGYEGLQLNNSGWFTVGKIANGTSVQAKSGADAATALSEATSSLASIERYTSGRNVVNASIDPSSNQIVWSMTLSDNGADNYNETSWCWHLDGTLSVSTLRTYKVQYLEQGTKTSLAADKPGSAIFNTTVDEDAITIPGYTVCGNKTQTITIDNDSSKNVITFYYTKNTYTVTYKVDGVQVGDVETYKYGDPVTIRDKFVKEGYTVTDWSKTADFTMPANDVVITATSSVNSYTVTYKVDDVQVGEVETYAYGANVTIRDKYVKEGYTVSDWSKTEGFKMPANDVVITATSSINSYKVTYKVDGVQVGDEETYEYGADVTIRDKYVKEGYTVSDWSKTEGFKMPAENVVITATTNKRTDLSYTVNYLNEKGEAVATAKVANNQTFDTVISSKNEVIEIANYVFEGADKETLTIGVGENVINLYYTKDEKTDSNNDTNGDKPGDGIPDKYQAVVNFKAGSNGTLKGNTTHVITLKNAEGDYAEKQTVEVTGPTASANSRYDFDGWTGDAKCNSSAFKAEMKLEGGKSYTVTANFSRRSSGGGSHSGGTTIKDPEVPLGGLQLNKDDHFAYIKGYADGTVRPNNFITRAQVATIFYRLMTKETRTMYFSESNDFSDVSDDYWANKAISTLSNAGIITGFYDGTFRPNAFITRAQFAAIAARFSVVTEDLPNPFSDVPEGYWAEDLIAFAADVGWVNGYADGTFRPTANITRAAAMKLINNVLERQVDEDGLLKNATQWNDCTPDDWCYYIVMEATNSHDWERRSKKSLVEDWTALTADPVWDE